MTQGTLHDPRLFCFEGVDPIRLDTFRRTFAATFLVYMAFRFQYAREWLTDFGFHWTAETAYYFDPDPFPLLRAWQLPLFGVLLFGSTLCLIVGYRVAIATWLVCGCAFYVLYADELSAFTLNRLYAVWFLVLALSPPTRSVALDDGKLRELQSVWPIRIIQATLLLEYLTAGVCKVCHGDWNWNQPDVLWTHVQGAYRTDLAAWLLHVLPKHAWTVLMWGGLAFELLAPLLFMSKRLVPLGILWGIGFHASVALLMKSLIFFSAQMMSVYLLFLGEPTLHSLRGMFRGMRDREERV